MVVYCSIKATFISPILVQYRLTKYKTSPAKAYLASVVKSHEKVVDQCSSKSDNCLHGATHTHTHAYQKRMGDQVSWLRKSKTQKCPTSKNYLTISSQQKSIKTPINLKCNYNKITAIMCMQGNVLAPTPKQLSPPSRLLKLSP